MLIGLVTYALGEKSESRLSRKYREPDYEVMDHTHMVSFAMFLKESTKKGCRELAYLPLDRTANLGKYQYQS